MACRARKYAIPCHRYKVLKPTKIETVGAPAVSISGPGLVEPGRYLEPIQWLFGPTLACLNNHNPALCPPICSSRRPGQWPLSRGCRRYNQQPHSY